VDADADYFSGLDGLQADMAAHQGRFAGEVTAESNRALAASAIERLERERAEAAPLLQVDPDPAPVPVMASVERREVDGKGYLVSRGPDEGALTRAANPQEAWFLAHAMPRIELLLTKVESEVLGRPSWNQRVLAVMQLKSQVPGMVAAGFLDAAAAMDRRYVGELIALLEASSTPFGPWQADPGTKLTVSG